MRPICWDDLRYLEALDRLESVARVARELGVSASTVYRRVAVLEESVGTRCMLQGKRGAGTLTDAGRALAIVGRETATGIARARQIVRHGRESVEGEVSLTTVDGFVPLLAQPLASVVARHPHLTVSLVVADQGPSVRKREVDVALSVVPKPPAGLFGRRLFVIGYGAFGTPEQVGARVARWIATERSSPHVAWEREHARNVVLRTRSLPAVVAAARAGVGLAVLPRKLAELYPDLVEASSHAASLATLERPAWILTHPEIRAAPRVRVLMDTLIAALR